MKDSFWQVKHFVFGTPPRGYQGSEAFNNFVIGSDTSGIQFPYGGIGAAFKCSFG